MKGLKLVIKFGGNGLKKLKSQTFSDMSNSKENQKQHKSYQKSLKKRKMIQRFCNVTPGTS